MPAINKIVVANAAYPNNEKVKVVHILHKIRMREKVRSASKTPKVKDRLWPVKALVSSVIRWSGLLHQFVLHHWDLIGNMLYLSYNLALNFSKAILSNYSQFVGKEYLRNSNR